MEIIATQLLQSEILIGLGLGTLAFAAGLLWNVWRRRQRTDDTGTPRGFEGITIPFALFILVELIIWTALRFPLQFGPIAMLAAFAVLGSIFAELKDSWPNMTNGNSITEKVILRTAQWGTLAAAGYVVVEILGIGVD